MYFRSRMRCQQTRTGHRPSLLDVAACHDICVAHNTTVILCVTHTCCSALFLCVHVTCRSFYDFPPGFCRVPHQQRQRCQLPFLGVPCFNTTAPAAAAAPAVQLDIAAERPPPGAPSNAGKVLRYWVDLLDTAVTGASCSGSSKERQLRLAHGTNKDHVE
ncbi:hypothetical protein COO60DRAFT_905082 [Scenedesmus sp. NREL 46B-D3]|nr:hypothetical protein COO60DRAFT_905082 [Scenedesmus sp. NREL 46B-D3]